MNQTTQSTVNLSRAEAARLAKVSPRTIDRWRETGALPFTRRHENGHPQFDAADVRRVRQEKDRVREEWAEAQRTRGTRSQNVIPGQRQKQ